jgi:hypothetical protein
MNLRTIVNILTLVIIMLGGFFKTNHWEGANIMLLIGTLLLMVTVIFAVKDLKLDGFPATITYLIAATLIFHFLGTIFKSLHWEGAGMLILIVYILTVITAIALILNRTEIKFSKQLLITLFLYLVLIMNLLMQTAKVVTPVVV